MKIIIDSADKISGMAAAIIAEHAKANPGCAMAFAAGRTTKRVYEALAAMDVKELAACKAFTVCEYEGLEDGDQRSCSYRYAIFHQHILKSPDSFFILAAFLWSSDII